MSIHNVEPLTSSLQDLRDSASAEAEPYVDQALEAIDTPVRPGLAGPTDEPELDVDELADLFDHTQLRPAASDDQIEQLCEEAAEYGFGAVCVHPVFLPRVVHHLAETDVTPCTVVGFPHGANRPATKALEAERAVVDGAEELDMVLALGALTSGRYGDVEADIRAVVTAARDASDASEVPVRVKVILETALLSTAEVAIAAVIARRAGADFVKTSTGFAAGGARAEDVALMRQVVGSEMGVKASGGVGSVGKVRHMLAHGATRIGASGSVAIMQEAYASAAGSS